MCAVAWSRPFDAAPQRRQRYVLSDNRSLETRHSDSRGNQVS